MVAGLMSCVHIEDILTKDSSNIQGLGNAAGKPSGTAFKLPAGVELTGEIIGGVNNSNGYWSFTEPYALPEQLFGIKNGAVAKPLSRIATRAAGDNEIHYFGSGMFDLRMSLRNTLATPATVTFPAATKFFSKSSKCQHAVLIKKVSFTIPAGSNYQICLSFYCGNKGKNAPENDVYEWGVVSDAKALLDLCDRVKNKKINIEEMSRYDGIGTYWEQVAKLQEIVWQITDHGGKLSESDIAYLNSLPLSN